MIKNMWKLEVPQWPVLGADPTLRGSVKVPTLWKRSFNVQADLALRNIQKVLSPGRLEYDREQIILGSVKPQALWLDFSSLSHVRSISNAPFQLSSRDLKLVQLTKNWSIIAISGRQITYTRLKYRSFEVSWTRNWFVRHCNHYEVDQTSLWSGPHGLNSCKWHKSDKKVMTSCSPELRIGFTPQWGFLTPRDIWQGWESILHTH